MSGKYVFCLFAACFALSLSGCSMLPGAPWKYVGWGGVFASLVAWFFLIVGPLAFFGAASEHDTEAGGVLGAFAFFYAVAMLCVNASATKPPQVPGGTTTTTAARTATHLTRRDNPMVGAASEFAGKEQRLRNQLKDWRDQFTRLDKAAGRLDVDRRETVQRLQREGVRLSSDLVGKPKAKLYADELLEIVKERQVIEKKRRALDFAIAKTESLLRRIDRMQLVADAGVDEKQMTEFTEMSLGLEETLVETSTSDVEVRGLQIDEVLRQELGFR